MTDFSKSSVDEMYDAFKAIRTEAEARLRAQGTRKYASGHRPAIRDVKTGNGVTVIECSPVRGLIVGQTVDGAELMIDFRDITTPELLRLVRAGETALDTPTTAPLKEFAVLLHSERATDISKVIVHAKNSEDAEALGGEAYIKMVKDAGHKIKKSEIYIDAIVEGKGLQIHHP